MDQVSRELVELIEQHYVLLYRYAYRLTGSEADAEDLTQQAFLVAQAKWGQLRDGERARSWLFAIVRNAYLKQVRHESCIAVASLEAVPEPVEKDLENAEFDSELLQNALNDLPEEFRTPVILFYFDAFSYKEIAEQMGVPIGTIMSRLARARAFLRHRMTIPETAGTTSGTWEGHNP
jgi:RNA polymerase sigma-70 factor, ECF subfamily